jgi:two-component system, chemotaxis family, protein-glutamate methylesterase/glutaminase
MTHCAMSSAEPIGAARRRGQAVDEANGRDALVVIGASTGGPEAIKAILMEMPADCPGILVTQHMPHTHVHSFADRLNAVCKISVKVAEHGERVRPGHAYIAPGHSHLLLARSLPHFAIGLDDGAPLSRHRPSVDALFFSVAKLAATNAIGIILTGMGKDGAAGMLALKQAGAYTFAQDAASCTVFGMPRAAIEAGAAQEVLALPNIAKRLVARIGAAKK